MGVNFQLNYTLLIALQAKIYIFSQISATRTLKPVLRPAFLSLGHEDCVSCQTHVAHIEDHKMMMMIIITIIIIIAARLMLHTFEDHED